MQQLEVTRAEAATREEAARVAAQAQLDQLTQQLSGVQLERDNERAVRLELEQVWVCG